MVKVAQIVEVGGEAFGTRVFQHAANGDFGLGRVPYFGVSFRTCVFQFGSVVVELEVFCYECLHVLVADSIVVCHHIIDGIVVHMIAQYLFGTDLVTVCHSHVVHLVAEADDEHILRISPCGSYAHPCGNLVLGFFVLPVAYYHFAVLSHTCHDVSKFAVAVSRLV